MKTLSCTLNLLVYDEYQTYSSEKNRNKQVTALKSIAVTRLIIHLNYKQGKFKSIKYYLSVYEELLHMYIMCHQEVEW